MHKQERQGAEANVQRILDILNFRPPKTQKGRLYGDPRTGLDYDTLFECSQELGEFMDSWLAAECRVDRWPLRTQLEEDLNRRAISLSPANEGRVTFKFSRPIREELDLGLGGGFKYDANPGRTEAVSLFFQFITGPFWKDVGRCKRCRKYFWNRWGHADKVYCSGPCASADTATRATQERRLREHKSKLAAARRAIARFEQLPADRRSLLKAKWKSSVAKEATRESGQDVTSNFITRAINQGELKAPKGIAK
jgi:hypothetical protein